MKPITPTLSPEQQRAKNHYLLALAPAMFAAIFGLAVISTLLNIFLRLINISKGSDGAFIFIPLTFSGFLLAHLWAVRKVKMAGFSLASQHIEIVTRVGTEPKFEVATWWYPKTLLGSLANTLGLLVVSAAGWWLRHIEPSSVAQKIVGFVAFWMFLWGGSVKIMFFRSPLIRFDNNGIIAFPSAFMRRRVRWADIAECEIRHFTNFMGRGPTRFFAFKSARGKTLLRLTPGSFADLSCDEQAEIEREIRRRMGHQTQNPPQ